MYVLQPSVDRLVPVYCCELLDAKDIECIHIYQWTSFFSPLPFFYISFNSTPIHSGITYVGLCNVQEWDVPCGWQMLQQLCQVRNRCVYMFKSTKEKRCDAILW